MSGRTNELSLTRNWDQTPGRVPGFWLSSAGIIFSVPFPLVAFIVAVVGLTFSVQAFKEIPKGVPARTLPRAAIILAAAAIALIVGSDLAAFLHL